MRLDDHMLVKSTIHAQTCCAQPMVAPRTVEILCKSQGVTGLRRDRSARVYFAALCRLVRTFWSTKGASARLDAL